MNTSILSKLATLAVALMMNGLIIAGVSYLFTAQMHQSSPDVALAQVSGSSAVSDHERVRSGA
jgi:hypothetical protein